MKIGVLTSSRADYGIYLPLLNKLLEDPYFNVEIVAFGTHLSNSHGFTVEEIEKTKFSRIHKISTLLSNDDESSIATSYGLTVIKFADFWSKNKFDLVFCLGDRFEMSAAVQAGIPFGIKYAHIHGGETTLGAIDNIFRHQITLASLLHFTASNFFTKKVIKILGTSKNVYTVGSLSLSEIHNFFPSDRVGFLEKYKIPNEDFILVTFHPETNAFALNTLFAIEMRKALAQIAKKCVIVITMPNADTLGSIYRNEISKLKADYPNRVICVENFGKENYFNAMYYSRLMVGNTSSGIIEAASFKKFVVNVGDRQKGRITSDNIIHASFTEKSIIHSIDIALKMGIFTSENVYTKANTVNLILSTLRNFQKSV